MKHKQLGNTVIRVAAIGQGCMGIGGEFGSDTSQDEIQTQALRLGIELGMNFIDTAEVYGAGHSEELVGEVIQGLRDQVFIATKFSPEHNGYNDVLRSAEGSLRRLRTDYIDLYQVHWPNPGIVVHETMRAMEKLLDQGKVRYIGVSNFSVAEIQQAQAVLDGVAIVSNQVEYNLFDRFIEHQILPYCQRERLTLLAYSPLDKGKSSSRDEGLGQIAAKYGKTVAQVKLNWLIQQPSVIVIPKAANAAHVRENAAAADFTLSHEDQLAIDKLFDAEPLHIPTDTICVSLQGEGNRKAYQTLQDALENPLNFVPSPAELAKQIKNGEPIKPVRLRWSADLSGKCQYDLIEGRIRYWAWVIAYEGKRPIPSYLRDGQ